MNYPDFLDLIYERHSGNVKLGLDRMLNILNDMDQPNLKLRGFHVAGTNGKGSTCAMLEALCRGADQSTGLNTSPHLVDYRERIRINGVDIPKQKIMQIYQKWADVFQKHQASFFEITTALAFFYFWEQKVDTAIFEVGLGGRLDGTNPFAAQIAAITTISFDHVKSLGNSLSKIAWEKAGIIKDNQEVVLGNISNPALKVITEQCKKKHADYSILGNHFNISNIGLTPQGTAFDYQDDFVTWNNLSVNLMGKHQAYNAGVALRCFILWMNSQNLALSQCQVEKSLANVNWQGRMQILQTYPTVLIDGAHNAEGISLLTQNIKNIYKDKKIIFVLAILRDKNLESMIKDITQISDKLIISKNKSKRAAEIEEQVEFAEKYQADYITAFDVLQATRMALDLASEDDVVIISGSLYTISEVLAEKSRGRIF